MNWGGSRSKKKKGAYPSNFLRGNVSAAKKKFHEGRPSLLPEG